MIVYSPPILRDTWLSLNCFPKLVPIIRAVSGGTVPEQWEGVRSI